ncbi:MAG: DUF5666 domain-containing protein, partial [Chromatocurvus sp.]
MNGMNTQKPVITASALALILAACGGGGGGGGLVGSVATGAATGGGGAGATSAGQSTTGTIDGFGSVFVNGVKFETDDAEVIIDGETRSEDALSVGMVVTVQGDVNDDGVSGTAQRILYDDEVTGPITSIEPDADGNALLLRVLGFAVIVERTGTRFDDVTFDTLAVDDVVEISGFVGEGNRLRATRIERKSRFEPGLTEVELTGRVRDLTATTFTLGTLTVDFSNADLDGIDGDALEEGMSVEVEGTLTGDTITASDIDDEDSAGRGADFEAGEEVRLQGSVTDYVSDAEFRVTGVPVDASGASFTPDDLTLLDGAVVQINGAWNGSVLVADSVEARRGRVKVEARTASVDTDAGVISLQLFSGTVDVRVDSRTKLDDDTDQIQRLTLGDIRSGDFLEVEAYRVGDSLVATLIDREEADDDVIRAPVEAFTPGSNITLLGITYSIGATEFEDADDNSLDADSFFAQLQVGDLVEIEDDNIPDGIADEVEFEDRLRLEGEREFGCGFDDDGSSCDDDSFDDASLDDESAEEIGRAH